MVIRAPTARPRNRARIERCGAADECEDRTSSAVRGAEWRSVTMRGEPRRARFRPLAGGIVGRKVAAHGIYERGFGGLAPRNRVALIALALASCRDVLGIESRSEGPPPIALPSDCMECVASACPEMERDCASEAACRSWATCIADHFDDPAGRAGCGEAPAYVVVDEMETCLRSPCQDACVGTRGLFEGQGEACATCMAGACQSRTSDCLADRQCERTVDAAIGSPDEIDPPRMIPFSQALSTRPLEYALYDCASSHCGEACRLNGTNLDCLSSYAWPEPRSGSANIELFVKAARSASVLEPVAGALIELCDDDFGACVPIASGQTDATGSVGLQIGIASVSGYRGFVRVSDGTSGVELFPTHVYRARPIASDQRYGQYVPTRAFAETVLEAVGQDPSLGVLGVEFLDCANEFVPGMKIRLPPEAANGPVIYPNGNVTGDSGVIVYNVQPGCQELVGELDGKVTHRARVVVAPGTFTVTYVNPLSDPEDLGAICDPSLPW